MSTQTNTNVTPSKVSSLKPSSVSPRAEHAAERARQRQPIDLNTLPDELKQHIVEQDYSLYTPIDHACWRFIMRVNLAFFKDHAHALYLEGLKKTGIPVDRIPRIEEMDACLKKFGWRAVAVSGFIPPAVFLDLQAKGILTIACDMRSIEHIAYTPAPDIVHEAAGHAPIIADPEYAEYLRAYGEVSERTIFSKEDLDVYEAIRHLSIVKEDPKSVAADIEQAQKQLDQALSSVYYTSEATQLSRMAWWTTEYGLVGSLDKPLIYGAGLLSSAGESFHCLQPDVKKIPLTLDCVLMGYDITKPQPHLYVAADFQELQKVLEDFAATTASRKGGLYGLAKAKAARTVASAEMNTGAQVGGVIENIYHNSEHGVYFVTFTGPCQLAYQGNEIEGFGAKELSTGLATVIGTIVSNSNNGKILGNNHNNVVDDSQANSRQKNSADQNNKNDFRHTDSINDKSEWILSSGIRIQGQLEKTISKNGKDLFLIFSKAVVIDGLKDNSKTIFDSNVHPSTQMTIPSVKASSELNVKTQNTNSQSNAKTNTEACKLVLVCAESVTSVYGGAPDRAQYFAAVGEVMPKQKHKTNLTEANKKLCQWYARIREIRDQYFAKQNVSTANSADQALSSMSSMIPELEKIMQLVHQEYPGDWLLTMEILELSLQVLSSQNKSTKFEPVKSSSLSEVEATKSSTEKLIQQARGFLEGILNKNLQPPEVQSLIRRGLSL